MILKSTDYINNLLLFVTPTLNSCLLFHLCLSVSLGQSISIACLSIYLSHSLLCSFTSFLCAFNQAFFDWFSCLSICLPILYSPVWTACLCNVLVVCHFTVPLCLSRYLWPVCLSPTCLCVSQRDPRLSMQPVMRCMLQSACEELIRKQQRPSHTNRHECVCVCVCVCLGRVWRLGSLPGTLMAVCRPTGVLIWRGRQTEMNSDPQRNSTVHVWVWKVFCERVCMCV